MVCCVVFACVRSDGWDRTAQLTSLTLLLLDGYHRTMAGFAVLVEKEWCSFGHRFSERHGQRSGEYDNTQRAPIFLQWLDCVWQVMRQHPTSFDFNELWLLDLYDAMLSGRYGTFLFDCQREREEARLKSGTESVWTWMMGAQQRVRYVNPLYLPPPTASAAAASSTSNSSSISSSSSASHQPDLIDALVTSAAAPASAASAVSASLSYCIPNVSAKRILLWERLHLRWDRHSPPTALSAAWTSEQQLAAAGVGEKERRIVRKYHTMRSRLEQAGINLTQLDLDDNSDDDGWTLAERERDSHSGVAAASTVRPSTSDRSGVARVSNSGLSRTTGASVGAAARVAAKRAAAFTVSPHAFARAKAGGQLKDVTVLTAQAGGVESGGEEAKWAEQSSTSSSTGNGDKADVGLT